MNPWDIPAFVMAFLIWVEAPPANLADASRREALRRQLMPESAVSLTNADVDRKTPRPVPTPPEPPAAAAVTPAAPATAKTTEDTQDESWWHDRLSAARAAFGRDSLLADSLQSRVNALASDWSARDDPGQRQQLFEQRVRVLAELTRMKDQLTVDQKMIDDIQEDARRKGVPAGWVR